MSFINKFKHQSQDAPTPPPPVNDNTRPSSGVSGSESKSPLAPRFFNITDNETVHQRIFLLHGGAGPEGQQFDASVVIQHHLNSFPPQRYPVGDGFFKALVHLEPGPNYLRVSYEPPGGGQVISSNLVINYVPLLQNPPLHLVLILGKDSKGTFDSQRYKREREGNDLNVAIKKVRMAGYMISALTGEQMYRHGFGRRTFRLYEEWEPDTVSNRDNLSRSTAKVHVIRSEKTVAEILDPNIAQQNKDANDKGKLFGIALDALRAQGGKFDNGGKPVHVACLFLDAHWDPKQKLILGHAALGGGANNIRLAIFGGHSLYTWPTCLEDIVPCFMDETGTDTREVANDSDQSGTAWENLNVAMGAWAHEIGHLLGAPHSGGIMIRDYVVWNRSFMVRDPKKCTRTGKPGMHLTLPKDECEWVRVDALRFKFHPSFRLPHEYPAPANATNPNLYPVGEGAVVKSDTGVYLIEIHCDGKRVHLEYPNKPEHEIFLYEEELRMRLPADKQDPNKPIKLEILAVGEKQVGVPNFRELMSQARYTTNGNVMAFKSNKLGGDSGEEQVAEFPNPGLQVTTVRVFSGRAVDGVEFFFNNNSSVLFGKRGGSPHDVPFQPGEQLVGFFCRTGAWVDGVQIITNFRRSDVFGNSTGGSGHNLVPPQGYRVHGLYGNVGAWVISIGVIYC